MNSFRYLTMEEEFNKLPWDVDADSDTNFVDESYLKKYSSTYKILHGTLQKVFSSDSEEEDGKTDLKGLGQFGGTFINRKRFSKCYVPGFFDETKIKYPKQSALNKEQQELYLQLMIKYGNKHSHALTANELKQYELLYDKVAAERYEFIQFVKNKCAMSQERYLLFTPGVKKFVEELWQHRLTQITNYPATYEQLRMLPLVYSDTNRPVVMKMEKTLLELGSVPLVMWPKFTNCLMVPTDYSRMMMKYRPDGRDPQHPDMKLYKEQVSEDKNAEKLAVTNGADIVISANALKNIADNHGPSFERNWDIPVSVRDCVDPDTGISRKIVFVDKPLAPRTLSTADKNLWYYRIGVKPLICHKKHNKILQLAGKEQCEQKYKSDASSHEAKVSESEVEPSVKSTKRKREAVQSEESDMTDNEGKLMIDCSPSQSRITRSRTRLMSSSETQQHTPRKHNKTHLEHPLKNLNISDSDIKCNQEPVDSKTKWTLPPVGSNVSYRLWKMHKAELNKNDMKRNFLKGGNTNHEIKLLIRCKMDGYEKNRNMVYVVPKLEYQTEFGAECLTKSEITQQWMSLFVRPETTLCRVRVNVCTSEVIMYEKRLLQEVAQESVQHANCPISTVLGTVYNVLLGLVDLESGSYLLSHTPRLGAFVTLRFNDGGGRYNLHDTYRIDPPTGPLNDKFMWNPIDHTIVTPYHQAMKRVPGTFPPILFIRGKPLKKKKRKNKKKGQQKKDKAKK